MARIDIIQQQLQPKEQNVLDIYQIQIISMYDKLINDKNISQYLYALQFRGYVTGIIRIQGKMQFTIGENQNANSAYKWGLIFFVKKLLTDWHANRRCYRPASLRYSVKGSKRSRRKEGYVYTNLTKQQRGVLTKILKIENKRLKSRRKQHL